ncbi:polysaccharide biosynthesis C-terminal domain-containing protein [Sphaerochaeta sp. PS]|uniref:lipopolysaccharide biosynthesis protein n=1 Tax=Sphaerochaeta sp. PS TaxID=3076336 RepID=UPI0028A43A39|nr:polysaccharide biosynthesis C-terminal domain-containing protein [Sphaerochaeta sp. PS]MDT4762160.1 polysaccharide biosynthesis C-terminal domain-containing protein [Sphaerochaeta sp. PS]
MSRISNSVKNFKFGTVGYFISYLGNFVTRKIFVMYLTVEYLGLNGLFSNILSLLSFAELGIGTAICFSLYKPLAFNEIDKIQALMQLFRKAYTTIGLLILGIGLSLIPLLPSILGEVPEIPHINFIYSLFVINSGISYFLGYKRTLLIADQKKYLDTTYYYGFQVVKYVLQVIVLVFTNNYILFLSVMLFTTVVENLVISQKANKIYPFLLEKGKKTLDRDEKLKIQKNVFALIFHKLGSVVISGTDNILMVKFVNLASAGINSNYVMITSALNSVLGIAYNSISASVGNLVVENQLQKSKSIFDELYFVSAWLVGFSSICLLILLNSFISLWLGTVYLFEPKIVFVIVINFYLYGMLRPVRTFHSSMGLFWYDRYKPVIESLINLGASIYLAQKIGLVGILIGTAISTITTCFWFEPYVLFRFGLKLPVREYFYKYILYTLVTIVIGWITYGIVNSVSIKNGYLDFLISMVLCAVVPNSIYLLTYYRSRDFGHVKREMIHVFQHMKKRGK